jgi:hypothetical protein
MQSDFEGIPQGQLKKESKRLLDESRANKRGFKKFYENIKLLFEEEYKV